MRNNKLIKYIYLFIINLFKLNRYKFLNYDIFLDPFPMIEGRYWLTLSICDDPAHLFRKHTTYFDVVNSRMEFGLVRTFSMWEKGQIDDRSFEKLI